LHGIEIAEKEAVLVTGKRKERWVIVTPDEVVLTIGVDPVLRVAMATGAALVASFFFNVGTELLLALPLG
jgi:hypothetical protein